MAETFGERLTRLRTERQWTVYEAAKRAGMTSWVLTKLERKGDLGNVQGASLKRLAQLYRVSVDYLVHEEDDEERTAAGVVSPSR